MSFLAIADVKLFLEIAHSVSDVIVQALIDGVEDFSERKTGTKLVAADLTEDHRGGSPALRPDVGPLNSITSIERVASDGTLDLVDAEVYRIDRNRIERFDRAQWDRDTLFRVVYNGGYDSGKVPGGLKHAMLHLVRRAYDNRGGKLTQSAAGFGLTWMGLSESDAMLLLRPYIITGFIG